MFCGDRHISSQATAVLGSTEPGPGGYTEKRGPRGRGKQRSSCLSGDEGSSNWTRAARVCSYLSLRTTVTGIFDSGAAQSQRKRWPVSLKLGRANLLGQAAIMVRVIKPTVVLVRWPQLRWPTEDVTGAKFRRPYHQAIGFQTDSESSPVPASGRPFAPNYRRFEFQKLTFHHRHKFSLTAIFV